MRGLAKWCIALAALLALPGEAMAEVVVSPDGRHVYAARYDGIVAADRNTATGTLSRPRTVYGTTGALEMSPDGRFLYLAMTHHWAFKSPIHIYRRDPATGDLTHVEPSPSALTGNWADMVMSPDGKSIYATDTDRQILAPYRRDPTSGALTLQPGFPGWGVMDISADGQQLFRSRYQALDVYARAPDGSLTLDASYANGELMPYSITLSPDEKRIYAGTPHQTFDRTDTGWVAGPVSYDVPGSWKPGTVAVGSDDTVYATNEASILYRMRAAGGSLAVEGTYRDFKNGVEGMSGAADVGISPDGRHLYAAGGEFIPSFARLAGGDLKFLGALPVPFPQENNLQLPFEGLEIEINGGDEYTNDRVVTVSSSHQFFQGAEWIVSNDGGFAKKKKRRVRNGSFEWQLASTGPERLPKTVYLRHSFFPSAVFRDSIILDETAPTVVSARRSSRKRVKVRARDRLSGVRSVQVARNKRRPGKWRRYSRKKTYRAKGGRLYVRVRDRAGNRSRWRAVRRR